MRRRYLQRPLQPRHHVPDGYVCDSNHGCVRAPTGLSARHAPVTAPPSPVTAARMRGVRFACCAEMQGTGQGYAAEMDSLGAARIAATRTSAIHAGIVAVTLPVDHSAVTADAWTRLLTAPTAAAVDIPSKPRGGTNCNDLRNACSRVCPAQRMATMATAFRRILVAAEIFAQSRQCRFRTLVANAVVLL